MNWVHNLSDINYIAIITATIASYILGFVWYSWPVFGKSWAESLNLTKEEADNTDGLGGAFIISLISGLAKSVFMALMLLTTTTTGILTSALLGSAIAVIFTAASLAYYNGFARIPSKLTLINSGHSVIELTMIAAIIGLLQ